MDLEEGGKQKTKDKVNSDTVVAYYGYKLIPKNCSRL